MHEKLGCIFANTASAMALLSRFLQLQYLRTFGAALHGAPSPAVSQGRARYSTASSEELPSEADVVIIGEN